LTKTQQTQINYKITARRVLVIDENGRKLGEFLRNDAIKMAEDRSLDLVQVSNSRVPTCKFMDYGKHIYDQKKRAKAAKASSSKVKIKEVRMSPRIADGDMDVRIGNVKKFIGQGNHVKVTMRFKGADMRHIDIGRQRCDDLIEAVAEVARVEQRPKMNGRHMIFLLVPKDG